MLAPSPLTFFEVEFEVCFDTVEAREASFCVRPEALNAIDVDLAVGEGTAFLTVFLDAEMQISYSFCSALDHDTPLFMV
jgi:hypothetical protein